MLLHCAAFAPGQPARRLVRVFLAALSAALAGSLNAATFVVTTTADSGAGSLRQALIDANALPGSDLITFQIPGAGVHTISPQSALPPITDPVVVDASTQTGYESSPLIQLDGSGALGASGFRILGGNTVIRGFNINRFPLDGIRVETGGTNIIQGNFIGTGPGGNAALANGYEGVFISGSSANLIGGTNATDRNLISGNGDAGIYLLNATGNTICGNYIGTTATGLAAAPNQNNGVALYASASNQIGGADPGLRNVISGNRGSGVYLITAASTSNRLHGNYIGTTPAGSNALSNSADGITVSGSPGNFLGGLTPGEGNLLSGNGKAGVSLSGAAATGNIVQGNLVGTDVTGTLSLGNGSPGIWLSGAVSNSIGGSSAPARNLISGNRQDGIAILTNSVGNTVVGNWIGLNVLGTAAIANGYNGISISGASSNTIGAPSPEGQNVISGNTGHGVQIAFGSAGNSVIGNYVGTDVNGTTRIANALSGVRIESTFNSVGLSQSGGGGNLISGNAQEGILLMGTGAVSNSIQGNSIGTTASGSAPLGNGRGGIGVSDAPQNLIGGPVWGQGNLISANGDAGIYLLGTGAAGNQILGNRIGTDVTGSAPLGNVLEGIYLQSAPSNQIGGPTAASGNIVSANQTRGIFLTDSSWTTIEGNLVGLCADGLSPLGNTYHGVECESGANNNAIGSPDAPNRIAFAHTVYAGVRIRAGSVNNRVSANAIFSNGGLGIDLGDFGVTPNDPCDTDTGANLQQNFPVLERVACGAGTGVRGSLNSKPNTAYRLEFFATPSPADPASGQGFLYLGECNVTTGADCSASFVAKLPIVAPEGWLVTATATDPEKNTSEFGAGIPAVSMPSLAISAWPAQHILTWTNSAEVILKQTSSLNPPILWTTVTNVPILLNAQWTVALPFESGSRFYGLSFE